MIIIYPAYISMFFLSKSISHSLGFAHARVDSYTYYVSIRGNPIAKLASEKGPSYINFVVFLVLLSISLAFSTNKEA